MGTRGPPPTPTNILEMRESWRAKRNQREPRPERGRPRCPRWLDKYAKAAWKGLVPQLDRMGVLTRVDRNALSRYCTLWSRWRKAEEFLQDHGETHLVRDADGKVKGVRPYPQVRIANQLSEQLLRLEAHFGMTPSARSRIEVPTDVQQEEQDKRRYLKIG